METNTEQRKYKGPKRGAKWKRNWKEQPHKRARKSLTNEFIASVLRRCHGSIYLALRIIRRESRTIVSLPQLQHIIECSSDFKALMDESYNQLGISALEALADAVEAREEWAIKQVLNSPRAAQLQLGQPSAKINVDARSVSVGGAKVLDDIDLAQRLRRLGDALSLPAVSASDGAMAAAAIAAPEALPCPALPCHDLAAPLAAPMDAAPDAAPLPAPGAPQGAQGAPLLPDSPTSHNRRYVSKSPITEPTNTQEAGAEAVPEAAAIAAPDAGAEAPRKNRRSHRAPRAAEVAAESGAPRKRGRPRGSRDSGRKRGRDPGRGKNRATRGDL